VEANECLMVGVRPAASTAGGHGGVAPAWEKIACGSSNRRDVLNAAVKRAVSSHGVRTSSAAFLGGDDTQIAGGGSVCDAGEDSVEMVDMSALMDGSNSQARDSDSPVRSTSSPATRGSRSAPGAGPASPEPPLSRTPGLVRSLRMSLHNASVDHLDLVHASLSSGTWLTPLSADGIAPGQVATCEVSGGAGEICDLSGGIGLRFRGAVDGASCKSDGPGMVTICFMNPMLERNEYAITAPEDVAVARCGGDVGDHTNMYITVTRLPP
jgi:hypothetical protein